MVWPTISGTMVERRDQVFMTLRSLRRFISSTRRRSTGSTNAPFLMLRDMSLRPLLPAPHDELVGALVVARLLLAHAPRRARVPAAGGLPFAAAERVIHRVHGDAANRRPD